MFTLDTFLLVKCTYFIIWISDGHRGSSAFAQGHFHFALLCLVPVSGRLPGAEPRGSTRGYRDHIHDVFYSEFVTYSLRRRLRKKLNVILANNLYIITMKLWYM